MKTAKVKEVNLERGSPSAEMAVKNMVNQLSTCKAQGYKAVVLIHGYGSTGVGGAIKTGVKSKLKEPSLTGIVRDVCSGEDWINKKTEMVGVCSNLREYGNKIDGNKGVTVVLLK